MQAQKKLNLNFARPARFGTSTKSPLTGLVRCKKCESPMNIVSSKINKQEEGYSYIYFECRKKTESSGLLCDSTRINAKDLEKRILEHLKDVFSDKKKIDSILEDYNKQIKVNKVNKQDVIEKRKNIEKELQKVDKGIENLVNAIAENLMPPNLIKQKYAELEEKKELLKSELNILGFKIIDNEIKINSKYVISILKEIKPDDLEEMSFEIRKNFYRSIIKNIYISDTNIEIKLFLSISNGLLVCPRTDMDEVTKQQIIVTYVIPIIDMSKILSLPEHTVGQKIYKYRKLNNLYQKDIAKMLGICTDSVTGYEKERTNPSKTVIQKLKVNKII